jgi:hypothetical protein
MSSKIINGQFFTTTNPFTLKPFLDWVNQIPAELRASTILEPFAGSNNIPAMLSSLELFSSNWDCYDIDPPVTNNYAQSKVTQQNVLLDFPKATRYL